MDEMTIPRKAGPGGVGLDFVVVEDAPPCVRCGAQALLVGEATCQYLETSGETLRKHRIVLCSWCDRHDTAAGALITFFAVHGAVTTRNANEFLALVNAWAVKVQTIQVDMEALERDVQAWHRGEFDDEPLHGPYVPDDDRLEWHDEIADDGNL
jgi:uncharacterized protein DUF6300